MTKVQRLVRLNVVLGVVAVLLLGYLVLRPAETSVVREASLEPLFPDMKVEDARSITLRRLPRPDAEASGEEPEEIRLTKQEGFGWILPSAYGYIADEDEVTAFLESLVAARRKALLTRREETFDEYAKASGWLRVEVLGADGAAIAAFDIGDTSRRPNSYVRLQEGDETVIVEAWNLTRDTMGTTVRSWAETRLWPGLSLPQVQRIVVRRPQDEEAPKLSFVRVPPEEAAGEETAEAPPVVWRMLAPQRADADTQQVDNMVRAFTGMHFDEVVSSDTSEHAVQHFGLHEPLYEVYVEGKAPPEGGEAPRYVLVVGGEVPSGTEGTASGSRYVRQMGAPWTLTVLDFSLEDFGMAPDAFLPEPEEEPAEEPAAAGEAAPGSVPPEDRASGSPDEGEVEEDVPLPPLPPVDPPEDPPQDPDEDPDEPE